MKLNNQSKDELRAKIIEQLKEVPKGQRVQLDKEILEDLLFKTVTINKEKGIQVKLPIWSGDFLKKIDLSQIDFTNVSWAILDQKPDSGYSIDIDGITIEDSVYEQIDRIRNNQIEERLERSNGFAIGYDGTNANIDLTKSFEAVYKGVIDVRECNFSGLDFSHTDLSKFTEMYLTRTSISRTHLVIPSEISLQAYRSYFDGIDLSSRTINAYDYFFEDTYGLSYCSLRDTGININIDASVKGMNWDEALRDAMIGDWVGCYANGKKVLSYEEKQKNASEKREAYEQMKDGIFDSVLGSIEEQVSHMRR